MIAGQGLQRGRSHKARLADDDAIFEAALEEAAEAEAREASR